MNTIRCNNRLCEKEYSVQFDKCPFCGTPNPIEESERTTLIEKNKAIKDLDENGDNNQFHEVVVGLIWISIIFFGIRGIMTGFANMIFEPAIGCLTLGVTLIGLVSLFFILQAKKWALFIWMGYRLSVGIINGYISSKYDFATNIIIAIANIGLMVLVLQIKKNGVSAWSIIFSKKAKRKTNHNCTGSIEKKESDSNKVKVKSTIIPPQLKDENTNPAPSHSANLMGDSTITTEEKCNLRNGISMNNELWDDSVGKNSPGSNTNKTTGISDIFQKERNDRNGVIQNPFWRGKWPYILGGILLVVLACISIWPYNHSTGSDNNDSESEMVVFECDLFSFEYPNTFKIVPIQNAPHMVLKLESKIYTVSVSYWDYGISDDVSIWNDEIFERYKQMPIENGYLVDIAKVGVQTKAGFVKSLKIRANIHQYQHDTVLNYKRLSYLMIHDGYLFVFAFESAGEFTNPISSAYPTPYPDQILKGLEFKSNKEDMYAEPIMDNTKDGNESTNSYNQIVHNELASAAQDYNKELPEDMGFGMTMIRCTLENNAMIYTIRWTGMTPSDFSAEDVKELKETMIEGLAEDKNSPFMKAMLNSMERYGYYYIYQLVNEKGERLCSIKITPSEI